MTAVTVKGVCHKTRKQCYPSKRDAEVRITWRIRRGASPHRWHVYRCRDCKSWHIGHLRKGKP